MKSESQPLLDKDKNRQQQQQQQQQQLGRSSSGSAASSSPYEPIGDGSGAQAGAGVAPAMTIDMPTHVTRRSTTGSTNSNASGGIDIRHPPALAHAATTTSVAPASYQQASFQRFMGPLSLPASPPFEGGPVLRYADAHHDGHDPLGASGSRMLQQPTSSPRLFQRGSPRSSREAAAAANSFHRAQTVGSYIPAHHMMDVMHATQTPGRQHLHHHDSVGGRLEGAMTERLDGGLSMGGMGRAAARPEPHMEEPLFDIDPDFDTSAAHLMKIFNTLDTDRNGRLTYEELREGLLSMRGMHTIPPAKVNQIIRQIDKDESHDVSQEEFVLAFQQLATKAMAMSRRGPGQLLEFFVYDYGPEIAICRWVYSRVGNQGVPMDEEQSVEAYFSEKLEDVKPGNVRWISITGLEPSVVVRLANRYKISLLMIEDVLTCDKERMKSVKSQSVHQLLVGRCVLMENQQGYPQIRKEQVTIFLLEEHNTVISIQKTPSEINSLLLARIMYAGSKIRLNGPRFLVYALVDSIVDELFPVLRNVRKKLKALHSDVTSMRKTSLESVHLIQHLIREVNLLLLWLSPLSTVVTRMQAELPAETDTELKKHLDDLVDHVHALKEQTSSMVGWAKSLNDEFLNEQQYRMNQVIYILTMTTTLMLPAQFLTGVFGMNFDYLPLLKSPYGFTLFWFFTLTAIGVILGLFKWKSWW